MKKYKTILSGNIRTTSKNKIHESTKVCYEGTKNQLRCLPPESMPCHLQSLSVSLLVIITPREISRFNMLSL